MLFIDQEQENVKSITAGMSRLFQQDVNALASLVDPESPPEPQDLTSSVDNLKSSIATSRLRIAESRVRLAKETANVHATSCKVIEASIRILEQTIHGAVARGTKAKADYLAVVAETMSKKLGVQHRQLMCQICTTEFQKALKSKQENLEAESRRVKRKVRDAEEKLEEYSSASGVKDMAVEYAEILRETEKVKADIERLQVGKQ